MLAGSARWLRAAGYDASAPCPGEGDADLLARSRTQGRVLLSRDRRLIEAAGTGGLWLREELEDQAIELASRLGVDWTLAPFTRCLLDNTPLGPAGPEDLARIPERSRTLPGPLRACPFCGRVYWPGSHVRRMRRTLQRWRDLSARPSCSA
jgi:uncharacterized protein with PIN domain